MGVRRKVSISYHHEFDESSKQTFELRFGDDHGTIIPVGVELGNIDPRLPTETVHEKIRDEFLRSATVTVVLVGGS